MNKLRLIFAGTPDFSAQHLSALINADLFDIVAVYSQPDRPAGRGKKLQASPVKQVALANNIEVQQPVSLRNTEAQQILSDYNADVMVVVAYGLILPQVILDTPTYGCINVHASLLPRWRGAAPIQRAIEANDTVSGVTIMQMEAGLDTGPMLQKTEISICQNTTGGELHDELIKVGAPALIEVLSDLPVKLAQAESQDDALANYASKISKAECEIDWSADAVSISAKIRAFHPFPISWTKLNGEALRLHQIIGIEPCTDKTPGTIIEATKNGIKIACGDNQAIVLSKLQLPGKRAMPVADIINGNNLLTVGTQLG